MKNPLISVVMPVYNGEKYLKESIQSILNQTFKDLEFIIINDGSTDATEKIILSFSDSRIVYIKNKINLQIVKSLNKGISLAKGKYIARMDSDDISLKNRLEKQIRFMEKNLDVSVCGTWVQTIGAKEKVWKYPLSHEEIKISLMFNSSVAHPSVMIRKSLFKEFNYEEKYNKAEDYALWVNAIEKYRFANIPCVLFQYRLHLNQTDKKLQKIKTDKIREMYLKKYNFDLQNDEKKIFFEVASHQKVSFIALENLFAKLLSENKRSNLLNGVLLKRLLSIRFLTVLSTNTNKCIKTLYKFYNSSMFDYYVFSELACLKLLIKCFIGNFRENKY